MTNWDRLTTISQDGGPAPGMTPTEVRKFFDVALRTTLAQASGRGRVFLMAVPIGPAEDPVRKTDLYLGSMGLLDAVHAIQMALQGLAKTKAMESTAARFVLVNDVFDALRLRGFVIDRESPPTAIERVADERRRQVTDEGFSAEHDDEHTEEELARAAAFYLIPTEHLEEDAAGVPDGWPWDPSWWKPTPNDRVRQLVKACALIIAEIERLERAAAKGADRAGG